VNAFAQPSAAPVAGPQLDNRRVLAALVDLLVIGAGGFVLGFVLALVNGTDAEWGGGMQAVSVAWALYYYFAFESGEGQTLGKKLLKIRVIRADGAPAGMREIAIRTILRVVDGLFLYLVGLVVMLVTGERRQRLGDLAAGTVVADATTVSAPHLNAATAAPPAAATPEGLAEPERLEGSEPREKTPVDVGRPIAGLTSSQPAASPQVTDFDPFSSDEEDDEGFDEPTDFQEQEAADEVEPEVDSMRSEARTEWPHMYAARAQQAEAELSPQPQEPHIADVPALEPEDEPEDEPEPVEPEPVDTPTVEPITEASEPTADAPEPVEDLYADAARAVEESAADGPTEVPGLAGAPVEEQPHDVSPAAEHEPAPEEHEFATHGESLEEPGYATYGDALEEPEYATHGDELADAFGVPEDVPEADAFEDAPEDAPPADDVSVEPIETVSAIDLVMADADVEQAGEEAELPAEEAELPAEEAELPAEEAELPAEEAELPATEDEQPAAEADQPGDGPDEPLPGFGDGPDEPLPAPADRLDPAPELGEPDRAPDAAEPSYGADPVYGDDADAGDERPAGL
jgi:uncharacterized RDD family membrane protein YckC